MCEPTCARVSLWGTVHRKPSKTARWHRSPSYLPAPAPFELLAPPHSPSKRQGKVSLERAKFLRNTDLACAALRSHAPFLCLFLLFWIHERGCPVWLQDQRDTLVLRTSRFFPSTRDGVWHSPMALKLPHKHTLAIHYRKKPSLQR